MSLKLAASLSAMLSILQTCGHKAALPTPQQLTTFCSHDDEASEMFRRIAYHAQLVGGVAPAESDVRAELMHYGGAMMSWAAPVKLEVDEKSERYIRRRIDPKGPHVTAAAFTDKPAGPDGRAIYVTLRYRKGTPAHYQWTRLRSSSREHLCVVPDAKK